jgi:hypothetical protein
MRVLIGLVVMLLAVGGTWLIILGGFGLHLPSWSIVPLAVGGILFASLVLALIGPPER